MHACLSRTGRVACRGVERNFQKHRRPARALLSRATPPAHVEADLIVLLQQLEAQHNDLSEEDVLAQIAAIEDLSAQHGLNKIVPEHIAGYFCASALNGYLKMATTDDSKLTLGALTVMSVQPADCKVSYNRAARPRSLWRGKENGRNTYIIPSNISIDGTDLKATSEAIMEYTISSENPCAFNVSLKEARVTPELEEGKEKEQLQKWLDFMAEPNAANSVDRATGVIFANITIEVNAGVNMLVNLPDWHLIRASNGSCSLFRRVSGKYADE